MSQLKSQIIEVMQSLLDGFDQDIESGIADGTYEEKENVENRQFVKDTQELINQFKKGTPSIYVFVSGGNIQGISATEPMDVNIYDKDNWDVDPEANDGVTPEQWDAMIEEKTKAGEIVGIH